MKITHYLLDYSKHFLVVDLEDGTPPTRGPVAELNSDPAYHPCGVWKFRSDGYGISKELRGRAFSLYPGTIQEQPAEPCKPVEDARSEWLKLEGECRAIQIARFEPAIPEEK